MLWRDHAAARSASSSRREPCALISPFPVTSAMRKEAAPDDAALMQLQAHLNLKPQL